MKIKSALQAKSVKTLGLHSAGDSLWAAEDARREEQARIASGEAPVPLEMILPGESEDMARARIKRHRDVLSQGRFVTVNDAAAAIGRMAGYVQVPDDIAELELLEIGGVKHRNTKRGDVMIWPEDFLENLFDGIDINNIASQVQLWYGLPGKRRKKTDGFNFHTKGQVENRGDIKNAVLREVMILIDARRTGKFDPDEEAARRLGTTKEKWRADLLAAAEEALGEEEAERAALDAVAGMTQEDIDSIFETDSAPKPPPKEESSPPAKTPDEVIADAGQVLAGEQQETTIGQPSGYDRDDPDPLDEFFRTQFSLDRGGHGAGQ